MAALAEVACGRVERGDDPHTLSVPVFKVAGVVPDIVRRLDTAGIAIVDVEAHQSTLDDVFFALTGHAAEDAEGGAPPR